MEYPVTDLMQKRLDNDYTYHAPKGDQQDRYIHLRDLAKQLAILYVQYSPPSREQSLALTLLEQSVMAVNSAIARNE